MSTTKLVGALVSLALSLMVTGSAAARSEGDAPRFLPRKKITLKSTFRSIAVSSRRHCRCIAGV